MRKIKTTLLLFMVLLFLSGVTAFPLKTEVRFLAENKDGFPPFMQNWIGTVHAALSDTPELILYGTDWLAFAHLVITLFFIPVYINPVRYKANIWIGLASCIGVFFLAFICGPMRGIPFFHQLIDCSFGFFGFILLYYVHTKIKILETDVSPLLRRSCFSLHYYTSPFMSYVVPCKHLWSRCKSSF